MRQRYTKMLVYAIVITAIILAMLFAFVKPGSV
jgi:hypothetical protein